MFGGAEVANFKAFDSHVALVVNSKDALPGGGSEMLCIENSRLAGIALKSNVSISRVARRLDGYQLFVDSTPHIDGTTCTCGVRSVLDGAPRCRLGAGIRIIARRRHIKRRVGLAKGPGYAD